MTYLQRRYAELLRFPCRAYTHLSHARTHSIQGAIASTTRCSLKNLICTHRCVQIHEPLSSSSSVARGRGRRVVRSETRLGETTPRLINPASVADEGPVRRQQRQRDNAHSTTGSTHRETRTHLAAGTCASARTIHRETRSARG